MDSEIATRAVQHRNTARVAQACHRCKEKKIRCDGRMPTCTSCAKLQVQCDYAQSQRRRGPGRSKKYIQDLETRLANMENTIEKSGLAQLGIPISNPIDNAPLQKDASPARSTQTVKDTMILPTDVNRCAKAHTEGSGSDEAPVIAQPDFAANLAENSRITMEAPGYMAMEKSIGYFQGIFGRWSQVKQQTRHDMLAQQVFAPLYTSESNQRFIEPVFDQILAPYPVFEWARFEAQLSDLGSCSIPAWRACANVALAITTWVRSANSAFRDAQSVAWAYYKTAFAILPELMVRSNDLQAVEAVLTMAMFVRLSPDARALSFLVSSASRLYQTVYLHSGEISLRSESHEARRRERIFWALYVMDQESCFRYGMPRTFGPDDMALIDLPSYDPTNTPMVNAFIKQVKLKLLESTICETSDSTQLATKTVDHVMETVSNISATVEQWRADEGPVIHTNPSKALFKDLDTAMTIHTVVLHLAYYRCLQTIHWPPQYLQRIITLSHSKEVVHALLMDRCVEAAQATLSLVRHLPLLHWSSLWSFMNDFVSAYIVLLAAILRQPGEPENTSRLSSMESFVKSLKVISQNEGFDLRQLLVGCSQMAAIARSAIEAAALEYPRSRGYSGEGNAQAILRLISKAAHPTSLMQNFMSNLKNKDYDTAVTLAHELDIRWNPEQRYGPFVPESLMPETYAFGFDVGKDSSASNIC